MTSCTSVSLHSLEHVFQAQSTIVNRVFQIETPAAEEPPVAYIEARRVPGAELLRDALVCPAPERKRGSQRGRPVGPDPGLRPSSLVACIFHHLLLLLLLLLQLLLLLLLLLQLILLLLQLLQCCDLQILLPGRTHLQGISRRCFPFSSVSFTTSLTTLLPAHAFTRSSVR
jgi:hypothetical protein